MRIRSLVIAALAFTLLPLGLASAGDKERGPWIHVEVIDHGDDEARINLNLPIALIDVAMEMVEEQVEEQMRVEFNDSDITISDLRAMWKELRDAGDADFVTIEEKRESVKISRAGDMMLIEVHDRSSGDEEVRIEMPVALVDELFAGEGETLNLRGAIAELQKHDRGGDLVSVKDGSSRVRIWID